MTHQVAVWNQQNFAWYADTGGEGTGQIGATGSNPTTLATSTQYRLRYLIQETAGSTVGETPVFGLEFRVDPAGGTAFGAWTAIDSANSNFVAVTAANVTDGGTTTQQIGAGTFRDGEFSYVDAGSTAPTNTLTATAGADEYEVEWVLQFDDTADGANFEFRVIWDNGTTPPATPLDTYTATTQVSPASASVTRTVTISGATTTSFAPQVQSGIAIAAAAAMSLLSTAQADFTAAGSATENLQVIKSADINLSGATTASFDAQAVADLSVIDGSTLSLESLVLTNVTSAGLATTNFIKLVDDRIIEVTAGATVSFDAAVASDLSVIDSTTTSFLSTVSVEAVLAGVATESLDAQALADMTLAGSVIDSLDAQVTADLSVIDGSTVTWLTVSEFPTVSIPGTGSMTADAQVLTDVNLAGSTIEALAAQVAADLSVIDGSTTAFGSVVSVDATLAGSATTDFVTASDFPTVSIAGGSTVSLDAQALTDTQPLSGLSSASFDAQALTDFTSIGASTESFDAQVEAVASITGTATASFDAQVGADVTIAGLAVTSLEGSTADPTFTINSGATVTMLDNTFGLTYARRSSAPVVAGVVVSEKVTGSVAVSVVYGEVEDV